MSGRGARLRWLFRTDDRAPNHTRYSSVGPIVTVYRIGAMLFILWGLLHAVSGGMGIYLTTLAAVPDWAGSMAVVPGRWSGLPESSLGLFRQHSYNIAAGGVAASLIAVFGNWRNSRLAWIVNGALIAVLDLGMVVFMLLPGHVPLLDGLIGPILWAGGFLLTGLGQAGRSSSKFRTKQTSGA